MAAKQLVLKDLHRAAKAIQNARAVVVTTGAGMGVDSGLPDFRGPTGFWKAYPSLKEKGLKLASTSNPQWFHNDPEFAWGFFGHRFNLYKKKDPHEGFQIILDWAKSKDYSYFVYTSNVDGHFQRAGFEVDRIVECHGTIHYMQCVDTRVYNQIWPTPPESVFDVDESTLRLRGSLPQGPPGLDCTLARPNILMFGDWDWISNRTDEQEQRFFHFQMTLQKEGGIPFVVLEIGAGLAVATVRHTSESLIGPGNKGTLIRINPMDPQVPNPERNISIQMNGLEALRAIRDMISQ